MAAGAGGRRACIFASYVAGRALHGSVFAGQWELRAGIVVEVGGLPAARSVATIARGWESGARVIRIRGFLEGVEMAARADHGRAGEFAADMAGRALYVRVFAA